MGKRVLRAIELAQKINDMSLDEYRAYFAKEIIKQDHEFAKSNKNSSSKDYAKVLTAVYKKTNEHSERQIKEKNSGKEDYKGEEVS